MDSIVVLVSSKCNLNCPYCFASGIRARDGFMSFDMFKRIVRFFAAHEKGHAIRLRLGGGEPTLNPAFTKMLKYVRNRRSVGHVEILTNGLFDKKCLKEFLRFDPSSINFLLNLNDERMVGKTRFKRIFGNIAALSGYNLALGVNFLHPTTRYAPALRLAKEHGLSMRWSLAHPVGGGHRFVGPKDLAPMKRCVTKFLRRCSALKLPVTADCSTPLCLFDGIPDLYQQMHSCSHFCGSPEVVDQDGNVFLCYDTSVSKNLFSFRKTAPMWRHFAKIREARRNNFWLKECRTCSYRDMGKCGGGCPHHRQTANDADLARVDQRRVSWHFNPNYREYRIRPGMFFLKSRTNNSDGAEINKTAFFVVNALRTGKGRDLASVYASLKKKMIRSTQEEFNAIVNELVRIGIICVWQGPRRQAT